MAEAFLPAPFEEAAVERVAAPPRLAEPARRGVLPWMVMAGVALGQVVWLGGLGWLVFALAT